ncbi:helix-turn-helix transcriptional regulator [Streptomyces sp. W16]|uniref:helix-turn-helix domain-containing protein n=1 Tax=Streptomyces sp. W16 TaxID=3076631 RepID=UPI00295BA7DE|nr:helix-turn-helix transcriptional regulator [Streptomyces sp. W16]MDV9169760.1 helix-turn-helix transcriptional regulator [Streptomyces sp. W16]
MPAGGRPTVRSRRLGTALKRYRLAAKLDQPQAAEIIASSQARISRVESGHATPRVIEVRLLLEEYGVTDREVCAKLEELAKYPKKRGWWLERDWNLRPDYVDYIAMEDDARHIRQWQPVLVPGLLQTSSYAYAVIRGGPNDVSPERIEQLMKVRELRREKIAEGGAMYSAIIWEAVIMHPLMNAEIHRGQLSALLELGKRENVTVQVLPFSAGTLVAATSAFSAFGFDSEPTVEAVVMDELMNSSVLESPGDLATYASAWDLLRSAALTPEKSAQLIRSTLRNLEDSTS